MERFDSRIDSEIRTTLFNGAYSQVSLHRSASLVSVYMNVVEG